MISVVAFHYSNTLQSVLVDYAVTEMGSFDDYSDAAPHDKTMRVNDINTFLLHVAQCISFNQTKFVKATSIAKSPLKSTYSRSDFKVIKDSATFPNFKKAHKQFHYDSIKPKAFQKQTIGLQCYLIIPIRVTILHYNLIDLNKNTYVFKYLN